MEHYQPSSIFNNTIVILNFLWFDVVKNVIANNFVDIGENHARVAETQIIKSTLLYANWSLCCLQYLQC